MFLIIRIPLLGFLLLVMGFLATFHLPHILALSFFLYLPSLRSTFDSSCLRFPLLFPIPSAALLLSLFLALFVFLASRRRPVFLVDYACFRAPDTWRITNSAFMEHALLSGVDESGVSFMRKLLQHSGIGERTALPPSYHYLPCRKGIHLCREESETVFFTVLDELFRKASVKPCDIGVLVLNCCLFYPSPSLSAMLVNRYKMRSDIKTYNLSGMGCAASVLAVDMVSSILKVHPSTCALVVSSENMTGKQYSGPSRSMLVSNSLFRTGGAALLLSNRHSDKRCSKYKLLNTVRTNSAADDEAFNCITHCEDKNGEIGVALSKKLMLVAGEALTKNITTLAPLVLPLSEMLRYATNWVGRKVFRAHVKPYVPDFKRAFQHFCIHAGGKLVIQEMEKNLQLSLLHTEASRMTLHRFGNTSSTSVWYEMAYLEAMQRIKKDDRVWQVSLGSGFKCFSAVWTALRNSECSVHNPWIDCLLEYPREIPEVLEF